jgi:hypothetical protein
MQANSPPDTDEQRFETWEPELEAVPPGWSAPAGIVNRRAGILRSELQSHQEFESKSDDEACALGPRYVPHPLNSAQNSGVPMRGSVSSNGLSRKPARSGVDSKEDGDGNSLMKHLAGISDEQIDWRSPPDDEHFAGMSDEAVDTMDTVQQDAQDHEVQEQVDKDIMKSLPKSGAKPPFIIQNSVPLIVRPPKTSKASTHKAGDENVGIEVGSKMDVASDIVQKTPMVVRPPVKSIAKGKMETNGSGPHSSPAESGTNGNKLLRPTIIPRSTLGETETNGIHSTDPAILRSKVVPPKAVSMPKPSPVVRPDTWQTSWWCRPNGNGTQQYLNGGVGAWDIPTKRNAGLTWESWGTAEHVGAAWKLQDYGKVGDHRPGPQPEWNGVSPRTAFNGTIVGKPAVQAFGNNGLDALPAGGVLPAHHTEALPPGATQSADDALKRERDDDPVHDLMQEIEKKKRKLQEKQHEANSTAVAEPAMQGVSVSPADGDWMKIFDQFLADG